MKSSPCGKEGLVSEGKQASRLHKRLDASVDRLISIKDPSIEGQQIRLDLALLRI